MKIPISIMRKLNVRLIIFLDDILIMASTKKELIQARGTFLRDISSSNFGIFGQQKKICVTSMPDFTVSRYGDKFQRNVYVTPPEKEGQNYFKISRHSKREISF